MISHQDPRVNRLGVAGWPFPELFCTRNQRCFLRFNLHVRGLSVFGIWVYLLLRSHLSVPLQSTCAVWIHVPAFYGRSAATTKATNSTASLALCADACHTLQGQSDWKNGSFNVYSVYSTHIKNEEDNDRRCRSGSKIIGNRHLQVYRIFATGVNCAHHPCIYAVNPSTKQIFGQVKSSSNLPTDAP